MKRLHKDGDNSRNSLCLLPPMLHFPHMSQSSGTAPECFKNSQNHQACLLKLDKLWTLLRVWTDRAGQELQQEKGDHLAATTFPKHGGDGRLPQEAQHRLTLLAKDLQTSLVPRDSPQTCSYFMLHSLYISLQHKGESRSFLENNSHLQLWDDQS